MRAQALALSALLTGCALTSKASPVDVRYFSPEPLDALHPAALAPRITSAVEPAASSELRLGRVTASTYLGAKIAYRTSGVELGHYDNRRWTERPEAYVRRSLARALFDYRPLVEATGGPAPALEVELVMFEEVRLGKERSGRVAIDYVLHDDREVLEKGRMTVEKPAASDATEDVVAAIAAALDIASSMIADVVSARLATRAGPRPQ